MCMEMPESSISGGETTKFRVVASGNAVGVRAKDKRKNIPFSKNARNEEAVKKAIKMYNEVWCLNKKLCETSMGEWHEHKEREPGVSTSRGQGGQPKSRTWNRDEVGKAKGT
ncbi:hypothetical protein U1Q18_017413 [Sarracenia purpurea var. burkii]